MKRIALVLIALASLTGCAFLQDNPSSARLVVQVAVSEVISKGDSCERSDIALQAAADARQVLDEGVLALIDLDRELQRILAESGVSPVTAALLYDVAVQVVVSNTTDEGVLTTDVLSEDAEITIRELIESVEFVAGLYQAEC